MRAVRCRRGEIRTAREAVTAPTVEKSPLPSGGRGNNADNRGEKGSGGVSEGDGDTAAAGDPMEPVQQPADNAVGGCDASGCSDGDHTAGARKDDNIALKYEATLI
ncbi:hypothetical protein PI124_g21064 [Phytophthora idaei]|nr:hypothetical protein PI124_g21064 [Phytophthora idaei]